MPRKKIEPVKIKVRGKVRWYVTTPTDLVSIENPKRKFFRTEAGAKAHANDLEASRANTGRRLLMLAPEKQTALLQLVEVMGPRILEAPDAGRAYLNANRREERSISTAIAECIESRVQMGNRKRSIQSLTSTLRRFEVDRGERTIDTVTPAEIDAWLGGIRVAKGKPRAGQAISRPTRRGYLTDLRTLFSFAMSRGYCSSNPACAIERPAHEDMPRGILTVDQSRKLLKWVAENDREMLACVCLMLFAGIRPDEARWLKKEAFTGSEIVIGGAEAKLRERRVVEVNETLRAWLAICPTIAPPEKNFHDREQAIHKVIKPWPHDALRHSFVSYRCAVAGIKTTAQEAAHSEDTLLRHYRALVTKAEAEAFWTLTPSNVLGETKPATPKNDGPSC